jgi:hypothetical protein
MPQPESRGTLPHVTRGFHVHEEPRQRLWGPRYTSPVAARLLASFDGAILQSYRGDMTGTDRTDLRQLVEAGIEEAADRIGDG